MHLAHWITLRLTMQVLIMLKYAWVLSVCSSQWNYFVMAGNSCLSSEWSIPVMTILHWKHKLHLICFNKSHLQIVTVISGFFFFTWFELLFILSQEICDFSHFSCTTQCRTASIFIHLVMRSQIYHSFDHFHVWFFSQIL